MSTCPHLNHCAYPFITGKVLCRWCIDGTEKYLSLWNDGSYGTAHMIRGSVLFIVLAQELTEKNGIAGAQND